MIRRCFITIICLFCIAAHALTMQVNASKVVLDEAFQITLTSDNLNAEPDLTPLGKDFIVVGTAHSANYSVMNGKAASQSQWTILVKARHIGTFTIPSFIFGTERTPEHRIEVLEDNINVHVGDARSKAVRLTAEISRTGPYVNEQVIYTLKMHYQRQLVNAQIVPPRIRDGMMMPLGDSEQVETEENGLPTIIETQKFVVFPQKSGIMTISPARFAGVALSGGVPEKIQAIGPQLTLDVKPAPSHKPGNHWLPAQKIQLEEEYDAMSSQIKIGEPVIRTVIIKANGVPAELLPALDFMQNEHFGAYPDTPHRENAIQDTSIVGSTRTKVTYLFNHSGEVVIPALTLDWFNTKTGQFEKVKLPEHKIIVMGAVSQKNATLPANRMVAAKSAGGTAVLKPLPAPSAPILKSKKTQDARQSLSEQRFFVWVLAAFLGLGWFVTALLWRQKIKKTQAKVSAKKIKQALKRACQRHHAVAAKDCLLAFAKIKWPQAVILNLSDLKALVPDELTVEITKLSQALYQNSAGPWQGDALWQAFQRMKK